MAESVDALVSNTNVRKDVPVRPRLRVQRGWLLPSFFFVPGVGVEPNLCLGALPLLYLRISGCEILKYRLRRHYLCLGALPLLYPAASPSVFAYEIGKYTVLAVALEREYVVGFLGL